MMAIHLDIKLFSDILEEIGRPYKMTIMLLDTMFRECREMRGAEPGCEPQHGAGHRGHRGWEGEAEARPQQELPDNQCGHADTQGEERWSWSIWITIGFDQIDNWSIGDSSDMGGKQNGEDEEKDEALEQHLLEMEMDERENDSD